MKLTFLGTGTSYGVPYAGCECATCTSPDPRDNRLRACVMVEEGETRLWVDTGPDLRAQFLNSGVKKVDAVLWTHWHNDHIIGLDDIRPLTDRQGYIPGYANLETMGRLEIVFDYIFIQERSHPGFPRVTPHVLEAGQKIKFGAIEVTPLPIAHGKREIFAFQFAANGRRIVYATDCSAIPEDSLEAMRGADVFIVDALRHAFHPNHFNIPQALDAAAQVGAKRTFFTHITHDLKHDETEKTLPHGVKIAFDGLEVEV